MRALVAMVALLVGCYDVGLYYHCSADVQCISEGRSGVCELSGFCSFLDDSCAGIARRYGEAPAPFGGQCVGDVPVDLAEVADLTGVADLSTSTDGAPDFAGFDPLCPSPQLLISVEDLETSQPLGEVRRFSIPLAGPVQPCSTLTGSGTLAPLAQAVVRITPDRIAVAGNDKVTLIDPSTDSVLDSWSTAAQSVPIDVAPIDNAGVLQVAVGLRQSAAFPPYLSSLVLYQEGMSTPARSWSASSLNLSQVLAFTIDPWNVHRLMMLDEGSAQALEFVDPIAPLVTPYKTEPGGIGFHSLAAYRDGAGARIIWTARNTYNGYYTGNDPAGPIDGGTGPFLVGPTQCGGCDMLHAVPDPTDYKRAFVLCDTGGALNSRVVHRATFAGIGMVNGTCVPVFQGNQLRAKQRLTHLSIAL